MKLNNIRNKIANIIATPENKEENKTITLNQLIDFLNIGDVKEDALSEATYFACLKILSEALGKLPLKLLKSDNEKGVTEVKTHPYYKILRYRPNKYMSSTTFWSTIEYNRNHYGNSFAFISKAGTKMQLFLLPTKNLVKIYYDDAKLMSKIPDIWYIFNIGGTKYKFSSEEILHFKTSTTFNGIEGISVREQLKTTIKGNLKSQKMLNKMYETGFTAKAVLQYTGSLSDENEKKFVQNIEKYAKGEIDAANTIIPIPLGSKLESLNTKLGDNEFVDLKKYSALQIAAAFGIKPNQINNYDKASYASAEAQQLAFYVDTLLYILKQYEDELSYKLLSDEEIQEGMYFSFNVAALLRADSKTQTESVTKAISGSLYTPNEARAKVDLPAKPGGDNLIGNGSMIPVQMMGQQYTNKTTKGGEN